MQIDLNNLPTEGQQLDGEISPDIFDISDTDIISVSPVKYSLFVQRFDTELLITGPVEATFQLTCMRSLHPFAKTISIPSLTLSVELGSDSLVPLGDAVREEILLLLPTIPRCDDGDTPEKCEIDPMYLAVDKPANDGVDNASTQEKPNPWAALDALGPQD